MNCFFRKIHIAICIFSLHCLSVLVNGYSYLPAVQVENDNSTAALNTSKLWVISRSEWLAKAPKKLPTPLHVPVPNIIISHTVTPNCSSEEQCSRIVRAIQTYHMAGRNWSDIGYNFLIGGPGNVYSGRGWSQGAHTSNYNEISIGIAFIGNFEYFSPTESQIRSCKKLIERGVQAGYIQKDYKLFGARQLTPSTSPGTMLFNEIKKWEHWAENP